MRGFGMATVTGRVDSVRKGIAWVTWKHGLRGGGYAIKACGLKEGDELDIGILAYELDPHSPSRPSSIWRKGAFYAWDERPV